MLSDQDVQAIIAKKMTNKYAESIGFPQVATAINSWTSEKKAEWISLIARGDNKGIQWVQSEILSLAKTKADQAAAQALSDGNLSLNELKVLLD